MKFCLNSEHGITSLFGTIFKFCKNICECWTTQRQNYIDKFNTFCGFHWRPLICQILIEKLEKVANSAAFSSDSSECLAGLFRGIKILLLLKSRYFCFSTVFQVSEQWRGHLYREVCWQTSTKGELYPLDHVQLWKDFLTSSLNLFTQQANKNNYNTVWFLRSVSNEVCWGLF